MAVDPVIELARRRKLEVRHTRESMPIARLEALEAQIDALSQAVTEAAADRAQLLDICRALDDRISSFAVKVERAA